MTFRELSTYLEQLEKTTSRNEITRILAELFKKASPFEIDKICYLVLGELVPAYQGIEFNLAERMMVRILALAFQKPEKEVQMLYKKKGDLGDVAEGISSGKCQISNITATEVYNRLMEIACEAGSGSQERKVIKMAKLLSELDSLSVRFVARIPVGKLRLGFSNLTILDAFSVMEKGDKSARPKIEAAYNVTADIGKIAQQVKSGGVAALAHLRAQPGIPIRPSLAERVPSIEETLAKAGPEVGIEPKLDGFRCITGNTSVYIKDKGYIAIKDVKVGDWVLTHKGRYRRILVLNKRIIDRGEKLFKFQSYLGDEFRITGGHRVLVWKKDKPEWVPVEQVSPGDELVFPKVKFLGQRSKLLPNPHLYLQDTSGYSKTIHANRDFYRLLGFWIGDGFTNEYHNMERIGLLFNAEKEKTLAKEYKAIVKKTLGVAKVFQSEFTGVLSVYWRDKPFREWLTRYFRREWQGKMLPKWFWAVPRDAFEAFLKGWIESDGTPRHGGGFKIVTKERDLAAFAQLLALYNKKIIGIKKAQVRLGATGYRGTYYELTIPGTERKARIVGNKILIKVLKKKKMKADSRTRLFNLQVEGDESYCTSMVALHNCQIHIYPEDHKKRVALFSRNSENTTHMFPEILDAARKLPVESVILDGEAIAYNPKTGKFLPFQETVQRKRKHGIEEAAKKLPLKIFIFDILYLDGRSLLELPFRQRREILEKTLKGYEDGIKINKQLVTSDTEVIRQELKRNVEVGLEGLVAKKLDAPYQAGARGFHWIKIKATSAALERLRGDITAAKSVGMLDTVDCVVMGAYRGRGKRAVFGVGGFLLGVRGADDKFYSISKLGTGLSDEQFREANRRAEKLKVGEQPKEYVTIKEETPDVWMRPSLIVEILADEITISPRHGYSLRFPRLVRFRDDKNPEDATTVGEIEGMFEAQKRAKVGEKE